MDKKLTLSLDQLVIEKAKKYAKSNRTSLSKMIEAYFDSLTASNIDEEQIKITPLVDSLCGVIELADDFSYKEARAKHLLDKYK